MGFLIIEYLSLNLIIYYLQTVPHFLTDSEKETS